jgi:adenosylcobinamide-GDP ribazoletransferase
VSFLRREFVLVGAALQFLTRLPVPMRTTFEAQEPVRATRWFPLIGQFVGLVCALVWYGAAQIWDPFVASALAVAAGALLTGGFHEDGLMDAADGFFAHGDQPRRLAAMKDSRIGAAGVTSAVLVTFLRIAALAQLAPAQGVVALVLAHGAARAAAVALMAATPYAGEIGLAKGRPGKMRPTGAEAVFAVLWGFAPLAILGPGRALLALALLGAATFLVGRASARAFGGHTGDVLGAVEQLCEVAALLAALAQI